MMRCILKLVLFLNKNILRKIKNIPRISNKLEITNGNGGVWL
jgi:hypothetical protein